MKAVSTLVSIGMLFVVTASADAQERQYFSTDPAVVASLKESVRLTWEGEAAYQRDEIASAIQSFRAALAIQRSLKGTVRGSAYGLAKSLQKSGDGKGALIAYAEAVYWDENAKDWQVNGAYSLHVALDYALCAAEQGRPDLAKEMYYWGLRNFNPSGELLKEPIPFCIVFDPDPTLQEWEFTPDRLRVAASAMILADRHFYPFLTTSERKVAYHSAYESASRLVPGWLFLEFLEKYNNADEETFEAYKLERAAVAKTDLERSWILSASRENRIDKTGVELRKNSPVVQKRNPHVRD